MPVLNSGPDLPVVYRLENTICNDLDAVMGCLFGNAAEHPISDTRSELTVCFLHSSFYY